jgi:MOSC domain-containing protein YiiM
VSDERSLPERLRDVRAVGELRFIGVRPGREEPMRVLAEARVIERGLEGDRASKGGPGGKRQVTLVQEEHLAVIAALVGRGVIAPEMLRRNLVVSGVNLVALKTLRFAIGDDVVLEGTGPCEPCAKMDAALGEGGFHAMRGHGGITARVITTGMIRLGDRVRVR